MHIRLCPNLQFIYDILTTEMRAAWLQEKQAKYPECALFVNGECVIHGSLSSAQIHHAEKAFKQCDITKKCPYGCGQLDPLPKTEA